MSNTNYSLEVISHHPKFAAKSLRKYYVDGIDTVGAWGDEPFEVRFRNHTSQKVQVKLSLDGTDILTGKPADTQVAKEMWVVNPYDTLSVKAWPESAQGGAAFLFTSANNSVAVHTHGDLSNRGIIAAAVFIEGHVETPTIYNNYYQPYGYPFWTTLGNIIGPSTIGSGGFYTNDLTIQGLNVSYNCASPAPVAASSMNKIAPQPLESLVSVGAGQHVDQKITYVSGLVKPIFTEAIRVKYIWWDDLINKLRTQTVAQPQPSGFPGDTPKGINLQGTPRIVDKSAGIRSAEQVFARF